MPALTVLIGPDGPLVQLGIAVSGPRQAALTAAGLAIPLPQIVSGLIDTGASCTCIDSSIIQKLGLQPTGSSLIHTPSTGTQPATVNQYDIALVIFMDNQQIHLMSVVVPVIESDFSLMPFDALIGRDVLARGSFFYHGPGNQMTLMF